MLRLSTAIKAILLVTFVGGVILSTAYGEPGGKKGRRPSRKRAPDKLKQGDVALDFNLKSVDGQRQVKLSSFRGDKPVALIFGSYT